MVVLLIHLAATWFMVGLIWFVQVVHYPLFARAGAAEFAAYSAAHQRLTTFVVLPPMLVELATAIVLVTPGGARIDPWLAWTGLALLAVVWLSTFLLQVPRHRALLNGFDGKAHALLVATNWLRAILWPARFILLLYPLAAALG